MRPLAIILILLLAGCNVLGGIPHETISQVANAGGGCVKVSGVWGSGSIMVGAADRGVIRNGEMNVKCDEHSVTIRESARERPAAPPNFKPGP